MKITAEFRVLGVVADKPGSWRILLQAGAEPFDAHLMGLMKGLLGPSEPSPITISLTVNDEAFARAFFPGRKVSGSFTVDLEAPNE